MKKNETQQFAKFFIKDLKIKQHREHDKKSYLNELNFSNAN